MTQCMRPGPPALDHLSIPVADIDRSLAFYRDVMGMTLAWRDESIAVVKAGGTELALNLTGTLQGLDPALHFGFRTGALDDVLRWAAYLREQAVPGVRLETRPGVAQVYFTDPDGYTLEIYFPGS